MEIYSISLFLLIIYIGLLSRYSLAWWRLATFESGEAKPKTSISVLIPSRNEEATLLSCLDAISRQDFPINQFEVIVIDDNSEDKTKEVAQQFFQKNASINGSILLLKDLNLTGKKEAINLGMKNAKHPLVVTTDADCYAPTTWLRTLVSYFDSQGGKLIAAPVIFNNTTNWMQQVQELELIGLQAVTAGGIVLNEPVMCNGANLCYDRDAFFEVGGYSDNSEILSGDDLFILQKINASYPGEIKYIKSLEATVRSNASNKMSSFVGQRRRWVSKVFSIPDWYTILVACIVYLTNLSMVLNLLFWLFLPDFSGSYLIITFGAKALIDLLFLHLATSFFDRRHLMRVFVLAEFLNVLYVAVIGIFGNIGKYNWKGRTSDHQSIVSNNS